MIRTLTLKEESKDSTKTSNSTVSVGSTIEEPTLAYIKALAKDGLSKTGHHGEMGAMGVPIPELPQWKDIQLVSSPNGYKTFNGRCVGCFRIDNWPQC